jgi:molecular chaperone DnaJ
VLSVSRSATQEEIKTSFRRLASIHHPDKNPNDPQAHVRFKEINASYQVLSDPQRRAMYDRFGHRVEEPGSPFGAGGPFAGGVVDISDIAFDGILGDLLGVFGVGRGDKGDIKRDLEVSFEEAAFGCEKQMRYERVTPCSDCRGSGSAAGSVPDECSACNGRGRMRFQQGILPIAVERTCSRCRGTGHIVKDPCGKCRGSALTTSTNTLAITIPPGVEAGTTKLVSGAGNKSRPDKAAGDLEITIQVRPHPFFKRSGDDVVCTVPITVAQAALGSEVEVPTLEGKGKMRVPPGTQPGSTLRIKGKGIPHRAGLGRGDQRVDVTVEVPTQLTDRQKQLLEQLAQELGDNVQPIQSTFFERLRSFFG